MSKKIVIVAFLLVNISAFAQTGKDSAFLRIQPFGIVPEVIDGGACYFSSSVDKCRNSEYVFVNDFAAYGCMKINGEMQVLNLTSYNHENEEFIYTGKDVVVVIRIKDVMEEKNGTYTIVEFKVKSKSATFEEILYGRCDC